MIETAGDLVWDLPCVQQASYMEGGPLLWILHVNQKYDDDDNDNDDELADQDIMSWLYLTLSYLVPFLLILPTPYMQCWKLT